MAKSMREARDSAEARLDAIVLPVADAVAKKAGVQRPTPRDKAEERLSRPPDKAEPIIKQLSGLKADELRRIQLEVNDRLRESER